MDVQGTDRIACKDITATISDDMFALFSMPAMRRLMPLTTGVFDEAACQRTLEAKAVMWRDFGFGPRAFEIDGRFAGWGGVQPEQGEADIGLGLHPDYWGWSRAVQMPALAWRQRKHGFDSVIVLLAPTRLNTGAPIRLGFVSDGEMAVGVE